MRTALLALVPVLALAGCLAGVSPTSPRGSPTPGIPAALPPIDPGWPAIDQATLRPGIAIPFCTTNFVFASPDNRTLYIGTAAHCVSGKALGAAIPLGDGTVTATLAYSSFHTMGVVHESDARALEENDFALLRIPDEARALVHPAMLHYGGPTGLTDRITEHEHVLTYGNTSFRDGVQSLDPREGYVTEVGPWLFHSYFLPSSLPGDSGGPVLAADGQAIGILKTLTVVGGQGGPVVAGNGAVNLAKAVAYAKEKAGLEVHVATWRLLDRGVLPGPFTPP